MASSVSVTATFLAAGKIGPVAPRRSVVMARCAGELGHNVGKVRCEAKKESGVINGRRELIMLGAAAAALWSVVGKEAVAAEEEEEPRRGSQEAKKKYAQVCVTMPTARICRY